MTYSQIFKVLYYAIYFTNLAFKEGSSNNILKDVEVDFFNECRNNMKQQFIIFWYLLLQFLLLFFLSSYK